jgi:hypothetical protein
MKRVHRSAIAVAALVAIGQPVEARDICWIDRVERTKGGVKVFFESGRYVQIFRPSKPITTVLVDRSAPEHPPSSKDPARVKSVEGVSGDRFVTRTSHDGCSMTVATQGDGVGIWVEAEMGLPGGPPVKTEKFIAAQ